MLALASDVDFGPHWTEITMVWLTGASVLASAVLGWLAYVNGKKATEIANATAEREFALRKSEAEANRREIERSALIRRKAYASVLAAYISAKIGHVAAGTNRSQGLIEPSFNEITYAGAASGEASADRLFKTIAIALEDFRSGPQNSERAGKTLSDALSLLNEWSSDPQLLDLPVQGL